MKRSRARQMIWVAAIALLGIGWVVDYRSQQTQIAERQQQREQLYLDQTLAKLAVFKTDSQYWSAITSQLTEEQWATVVNRLKERS